MPQKQGDNEEQIEIGGENSPVEENG